MRSVRLVTLALVLGIVASALVARPVVGADQPKLTQQEIEKIVHDYLLREPEVLAEALRSLQQRQSSAAAQRAKQAIRDHQQALLSDQGSPVEGNAQGKVTIVEFFDYRCVHCRRVACTIDNLMRSNASVRVIYKNFTVLGEPSVLAALAVVVGAQHDDGPKLHRAMP